MYVYGRTDIFEVMPGHEMPGVGQVQPFMSSSLQIAPGVSKAHKRPMNGRELNASYTWYCYIMYYVICTM